MQCFIYKGDRKADTYLYVTKEGDFSKVPDSLLQLLGELEHVVNVDLNKRDKLANADIKNVASQLNSEGYYVQMPPTDDIERHLSSL